MTPVIRYFIPPSELSRRRRSKATSAYDGIVASSSATKIPNKSRIETRSIDPSETERMSVRYSGMSPVRSAHRAAARIAKNADPETISLKYSAKPSTTKPSPKKLPSKPARSRTTVLPKIATAPNAAIPATRPVARSVNTPTINVATRKKKATNSGIRPINVCAVNTLVTPYSRSERLPRPAPEARSTTLGRSQTVLIAPPAVPRRPIRPVLCP